MKQLLMHWRWGGEGIVGGTASEIKVFTMWYETRGGRMCKSNIRICAAERIQGYNGIKQDNQYNRKISVGWGEQTCVKQLASLKEIPNHPSKIALQER